MGSDAQNNKQTYVSLNGLDRSLAEVEHLSAEALDILDSFPGDVGFYPGSQIIQIAGLPSSKISAGPLSRLTSISVLGNLRYYVGDDLNLTVVAHYDNGFSRDVTAEALITDVEMRIPGTRTIQIHYDENGVSINTAVKIELQYLAEGETHPTEPEVILAEEVSPELKSQKASKIALPLILVVLLGSASVILIKKSRKPKRRRRRKMYL